jgi:hypothetical protein
MPCRTKKSSTCLHLMMHIFMVHGVDPLVEEAVNIWLHMGTCVRSSHMGRRAYENPASTNRCSPISNISIHIYRINKINAINDIYIMK